MVLLLIPICCRQALEITVVERTIRDIVSIELERSVGFDRHSAVCSLSLVNLDTRVAKEAL